MKADVLTRIGQKADGDTPFYVFDLDVLEERMKKLNSLKAANSTLCYAMKANPFLIGPMDTQAERFEVCSPGELSICKKAQIAPEKIVFSGVNKRKEEMEDAIRCGVGVVTLESVQQYEYAKECSSRLQRKVRVMPRLTSGGQFGMEKEELEKVITDCAKNPLLEIAGLHYFSGTQKKKAPKIVEEARFFMAYADELQARLGFRAQVLEFGTGMAVPYFEGDDFEGEFSSFEQLAAFLQTEGRAYQWTLEFGRYLTASCGTYFTEVVDIKKNHDIRYALVDGGIHHLNYYGQNMAMRVPVISHIKSGNREDTDEKMEWCVCGSLCTFADVLVRKTVFTGLKPGDVLAFHNAGAYSMTEAIHLLLSRRMPGIYFYSEKDGLRLIRDRVETYPFNGA